MRGTKFQRGELTNAYSRHRGFNIHLSKMRSIANESRVPNLTMVYKGKKLNATGEDFSTIQTQPHETETGPGDSSKINNVMLDSGSNSLEGSQAFDKNHPNAAFARK